MKREALVFIFAAMIGAITGGALVGRVSEAEAPDGYQAEDGDFIPFACERSWASRGNQWPDGTERLLVYVGPSFEANCNRQGYVGPEDCREPQSYDWSGETVVIDYARQHRVKIVNMDRRGPRYLDLYDLGER